MQLGMVGLGRMGANMVRRLMRAGHTCVVYDRNPEAVKNIVDNHTEHQAVAAELEAAPASQRRQIEPRLVVARERLEELVDELQTVGVELKDPAAGLVDFVGRHQGHDVYLCWKLGEEKIGFFHELQAGFAGRQPISQLEE